LTCFVVLDFITKRVHHEGISCICVLHNLFIKELRTASLSTDYLCLFRFPRDISFITALAKQVHPQDVRFIKDACEFATRNPHKYLFMDLSLQQNNNYRLRTNMFRTHDMLVLSPV
jgi:hypothetical protein